MTYNLPDDWGMYRYVCGTCGFSYHLSGCETCRCSEQSECGCCGEWTDLDVLRENLCPDCHKEVEGDDDESKSPPPPPEPPDNEPDGVVLRDPLPDPSDAI